MEHVHQNQRVELVLPNIMGFERIAMACSAAFAHLMGLSADRIEDLKTIVAEAIINAIQHGNGEHIENKVVIRLESESDKINVCVVDQGNGFDEAIKDPDIDRIIENLDPPVGFGLFLIRNLADDVVYSKIPEGGHQVVMRIDIQTR